MQNTTTFDIIPQNDQLRFKIGEVSVTQILQASSLTSFTAFEIKKKTLTNLRAFDAMCVLIFIYGRRKESNPIPHLNAVASTFIPIIFVKF